MEKTVVLDFEFNCIQKNKRNLTEIIQIGAVMLDESLNAVSYTHLKVTEALKKFSHI